MLVENFWCFVNFHTEYTFDGGCKRERNQCSETLDAHFAF